MVNKTGELMGPWGYNSAAGVLFVVQIFGFLLNLLVIILMCRDAKVTHFLHRLVEFFDNRWKYADLESNQYHHIQFSLLWFCGLHSWQSICVGFCPVSSLDIWRNRLSTLRIFYGIVRYKENIQTFIDFCNIRVREVTTLHFF